jgi:hypothetical protein
MVKGTTPPCGAVSENVVIVPPDGGGVVETSTEVLEVAFPPAPVHVSVNVVVVSGETDCVPLVAFAPVHPPLAVQPVLFVDDHVSVVDWPEVIADCDAESVTVGRGVVVVLVAEHDAVVPPFNPPQLQVYVPVFVVTDDAVPSVQRFVVGAVETVLPLAVPQEPFVGVGGGVVPNVPGAPYPAAASSMTSTAS